MKKKNHADFGDFLGHLAFASTCRHRLSVVKFSQSFTNVLKKNEQFMFCVNIVTVYDHTEDTIHRWKGTPPSNKVARSVVSSACDDSFHLKIEERLLLEGFQISPGEWTVDFVQRLREME